MSFRTDQVRIIVVYRKKAGILPEAFNKFWSEEHPRLFSSLPVVQKNILKYEQAQANEFVSQAISENGLKVYTWDVMMTLEAVSFDAITEVMTHDSYRRKVVSEQLKYVEKGEQIFAANFKTIIDR